MNAATTQTASKFGPLLAHEYFLAVKFLQKALDEPRVDAAYSDAVEHALGVIRTAGKLEGNANSGLTTSRHSRTTESISPDEYNTLAITYNIYARQAAREAFDQLFGWWKSLSHWLDRFRTRQVYNDSTMIAELIAVRSDIHAWIQTAANNTIRHLTEQWVPRYQQRLPLAMIYCAALSLPDILRCDPDDEALQEFLATYRWRPNSSGVFSFDLTHEPGFSPLPKDRIDYLILQQAYDSLSTPGTNQGSKQGPDLCEEAFVTVTAYLAGFFGELRDWSAAVLSSGKDSGRATQLGAKVFELVRRERQGLLTPRELMTADDKNLLLTLLSDFSPTALSLLRAGLLFRTKDLRFSINRRTLLDYWPTLGMAETSDLHKWVCQFFRYKRREGQVPETLLDSRETECFWRLLDNASPADLYMVQSLLFSPNRDLSHEPGPRAGGDTSLEADDQYNLNRDALLHSYERWQVSRG